MIQLDETKQQNKQISSPSYMFWENWIGKTNPVLFVCRISPEAEVHRKYKNPTDQLHLPIYQQPTQCFIQNLISLHCKRKGNISMDIWEGLANKIHKYFTRFPPHSVFNLNISVDLFRLSWFLGFPGEFLREAFSLLAWMSWPDCTLCNGNFSKLSLVVL